MSIKVGPIYRDYALDHALTARPLQLNSLTGGVNFFSSKQAGPSV